MKITFRQFLSLNLYYFWACGLLWFLGFGMLMNFGNDTLFLYINRHHSQPADVFFQLITWLGDGWAAAIIGLLVLIKNRIQGVAVLLAWGISSLITQTLKRTIFDYLLRPRGHFEALKIPIRLIEGLEVYTYNSFPSGHATTSFAIFSILFFLTKNKKWGFGWLILALVTSFSRIYLAQHFPQDVLVGSVIGFFCALGCYWFVCTKKSMALYLF